MTIFPSALGGVNYSPASYDPKTNYVFNAAAETAAVLIQDKLTPTQKKRKLIQGDVFLGLQNGNFGANLAELARPRLDQRDQRRHRQARLEVRDARAGAGRGDDHRQRARLRRRRRRRPARVRRQDREGAVEVPDRRADRGGPDALPERRQGVPRDHRRRHADLVERRHAGGAPGLRDRRQPAGVPAAFRSHARGVRRGRTVRRVISTADESDGARRRPRSGRGRAGRAPGDRQHDSLSARGSRRATTPRPPAAACSSAAGPSPVHGSRSTATSSRSRPAPTAASRPPSTSPSHAATSSRSSDLSRARVSGRALSASERAARASGDRRLHRRLPDRRPEGERRQRWQRRRHRPDRHARRVHARRSQPLHVSALGPDHGRGREARGGSDRRHAHRRPRLLDVLGAVGRERELHLVLRRVRQVQRRSGPPQRPGRARPGLVLRPA